MLENSFNDLYQILEDAVSKCAANIISLSGGLDSTILAYYLKNRQINAITIVTDDFISTDLTYCQMAAKKFHIPIDIKSIPTEKLLSAIEETIKILKNFNDIEIRNSVVMYLVLSAIKEKNDSIITGDGADELFAGYSFFLKKTPDELQKDLERIWKIMHFPAQELGSALGIRIESPFQKDL